MRAFVALIGLLVVASTAHCQDIPLPLIIRDGAGWRTAPRATAVFPLRTEIMAPGMEKPTGHAMSPDRGTMFVGSATGRYVWAFRIDDGGSLSAGQPYCSLRLPPGSTSINVTAVAVDRVGRVFAATPMGVQVFDPTGRLCGVLAHPERQGAITDMAIHDGRLLIATERQVYERELVFPSGNPKKK
jgi:sugar lactone lactonase YvrE